MTATAPQPIRVKVSEQPTSRNVDWPKLAFLGVLLLVFAVYTEMAMGMEWRTQAGRIGPGFFPRILGFTTMAVTVLAGVREIVSRRTEKPVSQAEAADEIAEPDLGRHPIALLGFIVAATLFVALFGILGAVVAGILFLGATLWFLDPEHHIRAVIIAIAIPVLLYLAFQTGLNVGLPQGILPLG
ncbi:tripartite tricarboxylate transporter TctB family protein [Mycolicibacterium tusciae]|uniref:tripartite tricarboxylate transporter TctB family protein n=1 Tax=Mycolicibacterium tusciae TaxID=75922 RepID=UPI00024A4B3B|nr:tripartite tricarboxylate transporter TctB family protein [Mycolicibacterium tusciae]